MNPIPSSSYNPSQRFHVERSNQFLFLVTHSHGEKTISSNVPDCRLETAIKEAYRRKQDFEMKKLKENKITGVDRFVIHVKEDKNVRNLFLTDF